jgi:hypothetical protein
MAAEKLPILSYATPLQRLGRFRHLATMLPFCAGLFLGGIAAAGIPAIVPTILLPPTDDLVMFFLMLAGCLAAMAAYTMTMLLIFGWLSSRALVPRPARIIAAMAFAWPVLGIGLGVSASLFGILYSPPFWMVPFGKVALPLSMGLLTLITPFLLIQWQRDSVPADTRSRRFRITPIRVLVAILSYVVVLMIGRWTAEARFDRDCEEIVAWVKASHPTPGNYLGLRLRDTQRLLTSDWTVHANVLADGRVLLELPESNGYGRDYDWSGAIYASGPIKPSEIGVARDGRTQILIDGMPDHHAIKQLDSRHFLIVVYASE